MRLVPLCTLSMRYVEGSWHGPYGDAEALGFGSGDGTVTGELEGRMAWANYPRRREDGVWTPNLRGVLTLTGGEQVLVSMHGQSVLEDTPGNRRAILARVELTTEAPGYRWLNTCFLVGEGEIDEGREHWWLATYVCVNETAQGAPALGAQPPDRFRQSGTRG